MKRQFTQPTLLMVIFFLWTVPSFGQEPFLTNAVVNLDEGTLTIFGDDFGAGLQVFMGTDLGTLEELGVNSSTSTSIEAGLSFTDPRGTFLVVVSTDMGMSSMDVTFGPRVATVGNNSRLGGNAFQSNTTGTFNTAMGFNTLRENTTGRGNTATGSGGLRENITGTYNTAIGFSALLLNTEGNNNTASGVAALRDNTTGKNNTANGFIALFRNTEGNNNTASGVQALFRNTEGDNNTASGLNALRNNQTGNNNTASGLNALLLNTDGSNNTATGTSALRNTTGDNNIAIGSSAGLNATTGSFNIYIGNPGVAAESNTIRIGNGQTSAFIAGVQVVPPSSKRFKEDIHDMGEASTSLMRLRPVTFHYKQEYDSGDGRLQYGLIAEEVAEVYPELVVYDDQGRVKTVLYQQFSGMLLNELQKQHRQTQVQKEQLAELTERLTRLEQVLTAQQSFAALAK